MTTMRGSATCCLLVSGSSAQNPCPLILGQVHAVDQRPHNANSALLFFEMFLRRESGWISSSKIGHRCARGPSETDNHIHSVRHPSWGIPWTCIPRDPCIHEQQCSRRCAHEAGQL